MEGIKTKKILSTRYLVLIGIALVILIFGSFYIEYNNTKNQLFQLLRNEALSLMNSIVLSSQNTINSTMVAEELLTGRLLNNAYFINELEKSTSLNDDLLRRIAIENDLYRISIYDKDGKKILSNEETMYNQKAPDKLKPILSGNEDVLLIGFRESHDEGGEWYAVAMRRDKGGAIIVNIDAQSINTFRRRIGIGNLINNLSKPDEIVYTVLQDESGVISASENVVSMPAIGNDEFLQELFETDTTKTRITTFNAHEVLEVDRPLILEDTFYGIFRVGLSLETLRQLNRQAGIRILVIAVIMFIMGLIVFNFIVSNQNFSILKKHYMYIETYTGNILENMAEGVIVADKNCLITVFNKSAEIITGIPASEALGKKCREVLDVMGETLSESIRTNTIYNNIELEIPSSRNQESYVNLNSSLITDPDGGLNSVIAVFHDITEQKKLEEEKKRKDKMTAMGELASGVAHEIRNPLNSIAIIAQRFKKEFKPEDNQDEYSSLLKILTTEINRVNNIIQQFLTFARPPKLFPAPNNMDKLIREIIMLKSGETREKNIELTFNPNLNKDINFDYGLMKQVILNLVQNSIEVLEQDGKISIDTFSQNNESVIKVKDNGPGIPEDIIQKIFNLYFTTKKGGTGIGLSIVYQIITEHGGRIKVESSKEEGTIFTVFLPE